MKGLDYWFSYFFLLGYLFCFFLWWFENKRKKLRASCLLGSHPTTWPIPPVLCALVILEIGSCFLPRLAWIATFLFCASWQQENDRHPAQLFPTEMGLANFFAWLALNHNPPSVSLPGMWQCAQILADMGSC
jgi:hypothetical protein